MSWRRWAALGLAVGCCAVAPTGATAAEPVTPTTATFTPTTDWGSGFTGRVVIHNGATAPISSWRLEFDLPAGELLTTAWGALIARSDQHVVLTPVAYTKTIPAGRSITVGFQGTASAPFAAPTDCRFNGQPCAGLPASVTAASGSAAVLPTVPIALAAPAVTASSATLTWNAASDPLGVTSYDVYRDGSKVATATSTTVAVTGLHPNRSYRLSVRAVDAAGRVSALSAPITIRTPAPGPTLDGALRASYATVNDWGSGYVGSVVIRNTSISPVSGWQLALDLPEGTTIDSAWNADLTRAGGRATLTPAFWTRTIAPGGSVYVGLQGTASGPFPGPALCTLDGRACTTSASTPIGSAPSSSSATTASTVPAHGRGSGATRPSFAPYVDMTLTPPFPFATAIATAGTTHATLAFVVSGAACQATWGGVTALDDASITGAVSALRAAGGGAIVSFGGQAGHELADTCTSVGALAAQYQSVVDLYGVRDLDFDVEGADADDDATLTRRARAIALLQSTGRAAGKPVHVSFTLPVTPHGLSASGLGVLRNAVANGVDVGTVNVMAMDYYDSSLDVDGHMGDLAIAAATATRHQLHRLYPRRRAAALWRTLGVTAMLGVNDDPREVFTTADAAKLTAFARARHLGRLSLWSANRDAPCAQAQTTADNRCSGVSDPAWAFATAFGRFAR